MVFESSDQKIQASSHELHGVCSNSRRTPAQCARVNRPIDMSAALVGGDRREAGAHGMGRVCSLLERRQKSSDVRGGPIDLHQIASHQLKHWVICWDLLLIREIMLASHLSKSYDPQSHSMESVWRVGTLQASACRLELSHDGALDGNIR